MTRTALIAGASGLVGGHVVRLLIDDGRWDRVLSIGRRTVPISHHRLDQQVVDMLHLPELPVVDDAFCCLGTTIKVAGSRDAFRAVDHDAVVSVARAALAAGASGFFHVSALGAAPRSRIFYNQVKGEVERDVAALGFARCTALRPSMLDGDRNESRPAEQLGLAAMRVAGPLLGRYRPTKAADVAAAMVALAMAREQPPAVVEGTAIGRWAV